MNFKQHLHATSLGRQPRHARLRLGHTGHTSLDRAREERPPHAGKGGRQPNRRAHSGGGGQAGAATHCTAPSRVGAEALEQGRGSELKSVQSRQSVARLCTVEYFYVQNHMDLLHHRIMHIRHT